jgi:hypothetical protein
MNRLPEPGERLVFVRKSRNIEDEFAGYDLLEYGKTYTVEYTFKSGDYNTTDDPYYNWHISLQGINSYGFQIDSFESLDNFREEKLNDLLD